MHWVDAVACILIGFPTQGSVFTNTHFQWPANIPQGECGAAVALVSTVGHLSLFQRGGHDQGRHGERMRAGEASRRAGGTVSLKSA